MLLRILTCIKVTKAFIFVISSCKTKPMGAKLEAARHRQDLEKIIQDSDKVSVDSGFYGDRNVDEQDDAIELLGKLIVSLTPLHV